MDAPDCGVVEILDMFRDILLITCMVSSDYSAFLSTTRVPRENDLINHSYQVLP